MIKQGLTMAMVGPPAGRVGAGAGRVVSERASEQLSTAANRVGGNRVSGP